MPTCWIIAGPNGAGKITFALEYLPQVAQCSRFVNADLITLVPKLQLANPADEAPASRDGKLELPALNSQARAWELAQPAVEALDG
ncbi:MAG: hypothetical protein RIR39_1111 [Pseudomonadota bacterium]|jgi:hypothetical protein